MYGQPTATGELRRLAEAHGLLLLEDAALALGASVHGERAGTFGDGGFFSFAPRKVMGGVGNGGMALVRDADVARRFRLLRGYGLDPDLQDRPVAERHLHAGQSHLAEGFNLKLDGIQAAIVHAKFRHLDTWGALRRAVAARYDERLADVPGLERPHVPPGVVPAWRNYTVLVAHREALRAHLRERGITTGALYTPPVHLQPVYAHLGLGAGAFPVAESQADRLLCLPIYPGMTEDQVDRVAHEVRRLPRRGGWVSEPAPFVIVIADPSRPAYERAAREVLDEPGWQVHIASGFDDAELIAWAPDADVLITRRRAIPDAFLERAGRLRSVQHIGGVPRPEVVAWAQGRGVPVDVTPSLGNLAVAEQAMALLLAVLRRIVRGHAATVDGVYRDLGREPTRTSEVLHGFQWASLPGLRTLYGATVGVIGMGDIGRAFAARVRAFGTTVLYHQRHRLDAATEADLGVAYRDLEGLIAEVDVLSLHLPHTPDTERMLDERRLRAMKPGAVLINVSRGGLVDEEALVAVLREGHLGGAGLDVFAFEPVPVDHPLLALENVVVSPHVGAAPARGLGESLAQVKPHVLRVARTMKESQP